MGLFVVILGLGAMFISMLVCLYGGKYIRDG